MIKDPPTDTDQVTAARRGFTHPLARCVCLALALLCLAAAQLQAAEKRPNVVLMVIDDMGWKDAGCYGSTFYRTPHIDALAQAGTRYTAAYSAAPVCSPSRAAIMTGQLPFRVGITNFVRPGSKVHLPQEVATVGEVLGGSGYRCSFFGKWHLGTERAHPRDHGFPITKAVNLHGCPGSYFHPYKGSRRGANFDVPDLADGKPGEYLTDRLTTEAIAEIDAAAKTKQPFFLVLSHYAVHKPNQAKQEYVARYKGKRGDNGQNNATFAAMIQSVDDSVGAVRAALEHRKLWNNTVFILMSDNGGQSATTMAPLRGKKGSHFEGGVRVPLIMTWPSRWRAGAVDNTVVYGCDLYPTIIAAAGARLPRQVCDGVDLGPTATGEGQLPERSVVFHFPHSHSGGARPHSAVRAGRWRLLRLHADDGPQLFDLENDIGEQTDVAAQHPAVVARLEADMEQVLAGVAKSASKGRRSR